MKIRRMIGLAIVGGVLLMLTASYAQYSDYSSSLKSNGSWSVSFEGKVFLTGGSITCSITTFRAQYDSNPVIPGFGEYLGEKFKGSGERQGSVPANDTFVEMRVQVMVSGENGYHQTLLDKTTNVAYVWAGGDFGANGEIGSFSYDLGPYISNSQFSPLKITGKILIDDSQKSTQTYYLTLPDLTQNGVTDG